MFKSTMDKCIHYINDTIADDLNPLVHKIIHKEVWYKEISSKLFVWNLTRFLREYYTPSFDFLCCIYDFIIFLENIFMFRNDGTKGIQAYHNLKNGVKSFVIYAEKPYYQGEKNNSDYTIEYTLYPNRKINIKIRRAWGDKVTTNITFQADSPMMLSESDQILFDTIISNTMSVVSDIFKIYYDNAKPMKYRQTDSNNDNFKHE